MVHTYPPLNLEVRTPRLTLAGATDELLERLVPVVRAGVADAAPWPFDDPMSLYADSPDREWRWLRAIWAGRARVDQSFWRLYFVVLLDGEPIGMQEPERVRVHQVRDGFHLLVAGAGPAWDWDRDGDARGRTAPGIRRAGRTRGRERRLHR
ncbi:MAG TPA: hypothetical protein VLM11_17705, partial [Streptosporangiaceae bacterium]|nr:hypothetical protein [Streptosporangiaceae bacterium]